MRDWLANSEFRKRLGCARCTVERGDAEAQRHQRMGENPFHLREESTQWNDIDCALSVRQRGQDAKLGSLMDGHALVLELSLVVDPHF